MNSKCCCAPNIDASKNQILAALSLQQIKASAMPPFQRTQKDTEEIARRTADEVNRYADPFQRDTQRQLDAIVNALIALRSRPDPTDLLNRIIRNQNDQFDLDRENHRQLIFAIDRLATRDQAKDLLSAIAALNRDMIQQFKFSAREIATRFAAIGGAIIALGLAQRAAFIAEIAAKAAQTATILRAIAALKLAGNKPDNSGILEKLAELLENKLELEAVTGSVPVCIIDEAGIATIQPQPFQSYALRDGNGASTAAYQQAMNDMLYSLLAEGQIDCGSSNSLAIEVIKEIEKEDPDASAPWLLFPEEVAASYFTISISEIDPEYIRAYKLAGDQSEYGAGNWALIDSSGRIVGDFYRIFNKRQRLQVPTDLLGAGIRLSLKPGISAVIRAHGISIQ